jgi:hypothetical protein
MDGRKIEPFPHLSAMDLSAIFPSTKWPMDFCAILWNWAGAG